MNWSKSTLGKLAFFQRGFDITKKEQEDGEFPVVSSSGVQSFHSKATVKGPGVVIGRKGTLGSVFYIEDDFWAHDTTLWVKDFQGNNPRFVYYFLKTLDVGKFDSGGANPTLNRNHIHGIEILKPSISTQERIADILSNYDRLIDNNTRRITLLEESIHWLYKEWFVYLRFPECDRAKVVDGVPEGWNRKTVSDAFVITGGGTPSKAVQDYWQNGLINWYSPTDLTKANTLFMEESGSRITSQGLANSSARLFPPFSVMMTSRATIGALAINTTEACTNQGFITCLPNEDIPLYFLYCWLKTNIEVFSNLATGATFKEISKGVFKKIEIIVPAKTTSEEFEAKVQPIGDCILNLQRQNKHLREARDLLLPRLMNGSIAV